MEEKIQGDNHLPPTTEEIAIAIAEGERMIIDELNNLKGKIEGVSGHDLKIIIDI